MLVVTMVAVSYIHMQMQIFDLAYLGKDQERAIARLDQQKQQLTYNVLSIKSAHNLGHEMLGDESEMEFANPNDIVLISATETDVIDQQPADRQLTAANRNMFLNVLTFATRAEARDFE